MKYTEEERQALMDDLKTSGAIQTLEAHANSLGIVAPIIIAALVADGYIRRDDAGEASRRYTRVDLLTMMTQGSVRGDFFCVDNIPKYSKTSEDAKALVAYVRRNFPAGDSEDLASARSDLLDARLALDSLRGDLKRVAATLRKSENQDS